MPTYADTLSGFPLHNTRADGIHDTDDFMARNSRILQSRESRYFQQHVAMTNTASLNFNPHQTATGLRHFAFNHLNRSLGCRNLCSTHFWHNPRRKHSTCQSQQTKNRILSAVRAVAANRQVVVRDRLAIPLEPENKNSGLRSSNR